MNFFLHFPIVILLLIVVLQISSVYAQSKTLTASADTYIEANSPNMNFGNEPIIDFSNYLNLLGYIKFNLSSIPSGSTINSAVLKLYINSSVFSSDYVKISSVFSDWNEYTLTWNNVTHGSSTSYTYATAPGTSGWWKIDEKIIVKCRLHPIKKGVINL